MGLVALLGLGSTLGAACGGGSGMTTAVQVEYEVTAVPSDDASACIEVWNQTARREARAIMATAPGGVLVRTSIVDWDTDISMTECTIAFVAADGAGVEFMCWHIRAKNPTWSWTRGLGFQPDPAGELPPANARPAADGSLQAVG